MPKFAKIIHKNKENFLIKKFIGLFKRKIKEKVRGRFSLVLTGGKSPIKLYRYLSLEQGIPWSKIDFFISDERCVNVKSKKSNINMCKKNLLNKIPISEKQIYMVEINKKNPKRISMDYERKIRRYFFRKKISFDLVLLGIGNDGHIASLFKNNISEKNKKFVDFIKRKDFSRITLTLKCLNNSKNIFLWAPKKNKISIVKKIIFDKKIFYPASFLKSKNKYLFYSN
tara:strand:- start:829 stop:1509 length:681 start_codon:yes stop_codon:yes gene_type:complete